MRHEKLETIAVHVLSDRRPGVERPQQLLANLVDYRSTAMHERHAHLTALRIERNQVEGAIQNMFDFIEQGIMSARDADFTGSLATQRVRRVDLEQETLADTLSAFLLPESVRLQDPNTVHKPLSSNDYVGGPAD